MLVNLPSGWQTFPGNPYADALEGFEYGFDQIGVGQYLGMPTFAIEHLVEDEYPFERHLMGRGDGDDEALKELFQDILRQDREDLPRDLGVCDHPAQVVERWPQLETDPRPLIVIFHRVNRHAQPAQGGWRWHKHGKYIGTREPLCEYLYDEPDIESVYTFRIYQLKSAA
jgi:hypothetical protein